MRLTKEETAALTALGTFYASQCCALGAVEPTRHVVVWHRDNSTTRYDDDSQPVQFSDGDEIELVPAAGPDPSLGSFAHSAGLKP